MNLITWPYLQTDFLQSQGFSSDIYVRLMEKVMIADGCWLWSAHKSKFGYGRIGAGRNRKMCLAHRVMWIIFNGPIPSGLDVCHDCPGGDNPSCVRPSHLWLGTHRENMADMVDKGRHPFQNGWAPKGEDVPGAKFTWEQIRAMRAKYPARTMTQIAQEFLTSDANVAHIIHNERWHDLEYAPPAKTFLQKLLPQDKKDAVVRLAIFGVGPCAISRLLNIDRKTVYILLKQRRQC